MKIFNHPTIKKQAALISAGASISVCAIVFGVLFFSQRAVYENRLINDAIENTRKASSFILGYFYSQNNWMHLEETQRLFNQSPNAYYSYILGSSGKIELGINGISSEDMGKTHHEWEPPIEFDLNQTFIKRFEADLSLVARIRAGRIKSGDTLVLIATPVYCPSQGKNCAQLRAVISFESIRGVLNWLLMTLLFALTPMALAIGFVVFLTVRRFLDPVYEMSKRLHNLVGLVPHDGQMRTLEGFQKNLLANVTGTFSSRYQETQLLNQAMTDFAKALEESDKIKAELEITSSVAELASQVAHDIRSPLSALDMVVGDLTSLPEENRVLVRCAVNRIKDIANSLLKKNRESMRRSLGEKPTILEEGETKTAQLLSSLIDEIVTEKRLQFKDKPEIEVHAELGANSYGIFALLQPVEFKRMISNLLNNSIEVLGDYGKVNLTLDSNLESVEIRIRDNGKGIPPEILKKLGQRGETHGKEGGSGLGLFHTRTVVESWGGVLKIESEVGKGTEIIITLPKANPPTWFVPELILTENSVLAVLDDDNSVKEIWRQRLAQLNSHDRSVEVKYFSNPDDLEDWFRTSDPSKSHLFLLDYEIIGNKRSGLDLAESLGIGGKTILVSSRWDEKGILDRCVRIGARLIPKGLAGFVPIVFRNPQRKLDAILLDDDDLVISTWSNVARKHKKSLLAFMEPQSFFTGLEDVDRSSPIFIDSNLKDGIKGQDLIPKIRAFGFYTVYLATGYEREKFVDVSGIAAVIGKDPPKEIDG